MLFKRFLIWRSGNPPVRWSRTIYANLKEGTWGTFMLSYVKFGPVVQEEMSLAALLLCVAEPFMQFW